MYLTTDRYRSQPTRDGSQRASGLFLIVVTNRDDREMRPHLRAVVRKVNMSQLGHFMMGDTTIAGQAFILSGTYGHDGLPLDVPSEVFSQCIQIPNDIENAFWNGGGHNGPGMEAAILRAWAKDHIKALHRAARNK